MGLIIFLVVATCLYIAFFICDVIFLIQNNDNMVYQLGLGIGGLVFYIWYTCCGFLILKIHNAIGIYFIAYGIIGIVTQLIIALAYKFEIIFFILLIVIIIATIPMAILTQYLQLKIEIN